MNPEIKEKWVTALQSGDYQQGILVLHNVRTNRYCCLGVLCDIAVKEGVVAEVREIETHKGARVTTYDYEWTTLPDSVLEWAGLIYSGRTVITLDNGREVSLLEANDDCRLEFKEIADYIAEQL